MLEFKTITVEDKPLVDKYLALRNRIECNRNFATLFMWTPIYEQQLCEEDGWLYLKSKDAFYHPLGTGDIHRPVEKMLEYCKANGQQLVIWGNNPRERLELEEAYPLEFSFREERDFYDYVYDAQKLATLAGKKLHGKRNHINRFEQENPGWTFEPLTQQNLGDAYEMNTQWCKLNDCQQHEGLREEGCAVKRCLHNFEARGLSGGRVRPPPTGGVA